MSIRRHGVTMGGAPVVDTELSTTSEHPLQNKAIAAALDPIATKLIGIETGAQVNKIEHIAINGSDIPIDEATKRASTNIRSGSPFPSSFATEGTTLEFCTSIYNDSSVVCGMSYVGDVALTDMPFSGEAEVIVRVVNNYKTLVLEMFSTDTACNHWYAMYASEEMKTGTEDCPWQGIMSVNGNAYAGYEPTSDYQAAPKKYVDDRVATAEASATAAAASASSATASATTAQTAATSASASATSASASAADAATAKTQTQALHDSILVINNLPVGHATNIGFYESGTTIHLTYTDPANNTLDDGTVLAYWQKTRFIYKVGSAPENENDGTVLFDNTTRDAYRTTEYTHDMGVSASYYFALFSCTTGGTWNTQDSAPRWNTTVVSFATIKQLHRSGMPLSTLGLSIGSVVNVQTSDYFPALRWMLVHEDYTGCQMSTTGLSHNSIWIPHYLPCEAGSNDALMLNFDAPELLYGRTADTTFGAGTYYKLDTGSYVALTAGTDYNVGDSISTWETTTGYYVYEKNDNLRASTGNNRWLWSNMRQYLNATGSGYYQATHKFDQSGFTKPGFKGCFYQSLLDCIEPVYNTVAKPNYDGGGSEKTLDYFWLPSIKEVFNTNNNGYEEGKQFKYFANVATTAASRIQVDEGGTARHVWLRSPLTGNTYNEYFINTSGSSNSNSANNAYAFLPAMCIA